MTIAKENKRLPITLSPELQAEIARLRKKYHKSGAKICLIALELLIEQEQAGFQISKLEK